MAVKQKVRADWFAGTATVLAILACYGTLGVVGVLSMMGVSVGVHEGTWAVVIAFFAALAVVGIGLGYRRHRVAGPLVLAVIGGVLVLWAMFVDYTRSVEIAGFVALVIAALWDWRVKRSRPSGAAKTR